MYLCNAIRFRVRVLKVADACRRAAVLAQACLHPVAGVIIPGPAGCWRSLHVAKDFRMILVTGGAGFIGANFVLDWLATHGEPVVSR